MIFCPKKDTFDYNSYEELSRIEGNALTLTRRGLSSIIPRIYDPTGLLQPFILKGILILRQAWVYRSNDGEALGWDNKLPEEIKNRWLKWLKDTMLMKHQSIKLTDVFKGLKQYQVETM